MSFKFSLITILFWQLWKVFKKRHVSFIRGTKSGSASIVRPVKPEAELCMLSVLLSAHYSALVLLRYWVSCKVLYSDLGAVSAAWICLHARGKRHAGTLKHMARLGQFTKYRRNYIEFFIAAEQRYSLAAHSQLSPVSAFQQSQSQQGRVVFYKKSQEEN